MSFMLSLESWEHNEGLARPQMGPLACNRLHTPFYTPILLSPSPTQLHITTTCNIITTTKAAQYSLKFECLKVIHPHNYS